MSKKGQRRSEIVPPVVLGKRLSKASLGELEAMLEAFLGAMECILGATNQPRVEATAEDLLEEEKRACHGYAWKSRKRPHGGRHEEVSIFASRSRSP
jgi:hypothetical protein